jgi:hypothetical protein
VYSKGNFAHTHFPAAQRMTNANGGEQKMNKNLEEEEEGGGKDSEQPEMFRRKGSNSSSEERRRDFYVSSATELETEDTDIEGAPREKATKASRGKTTFEGGGRGRGEEEEEERMAQQSPRLSTTNTHTVDDVSLSVANLTATSASAIGQKVIEKERKS